MSGFLTAERRVQLKAQHKREKDKRICDLIKAALLYDEGRSPQQIAYVLLLTDFKKIKLHFMSPYSPNLNPIERLWKLMKEKVMYNKYSKYFEDFKYTVISFLEHLSNLDPELVFGKGFACRLRDKFRSAWAPAANF